MDCVNVIKISKNYKINSCRTENKAKGLKILQNNLPSYYKRFISKGKTDAEANQKFKFSSLYIFKSVKRFPDDFDR